MSSEGNGHQVSDHDGLQTAELLSYLDASLADYGKYVSQIGCLKYTIGNNKSVDGRHMGRLFEENRIHPQTKL